ncbi:uncharacterized protein [Nicotiana tomentosiformis]|uniref:uncharacterized protein n=1 Tax=Nicotiana tomentosiformis TaxID=4098 RepID=UPI00051B44D2|nr:uncharacterized protein LOC117276515 [Nicotiana tomentosiformis]
MEVYIDDILVKSLNAGDHLAHLQEIFDILRKHNMNLNPEKCAFRDSSGKFLGFLVSQRGIKVNPDKLKAIEDILDHLTSIKKVQRLTGRWSPNVKGSGLGIVLITPSGEILRQAIRTGVDDNSYPKEENVEADALANLGSSTKIKGADFGAVVQLLHSVLDVDEYCEVNSTNLIWGRRNEFIEYLRHGKLPEDPKTSRALRTKVARYCLVDGQLYRRPFQRPLAWCLGTSEVDYVMKEVHEREDAKSNWPEELPGVLWAYRTTAKSSMGETTFSLMYGAKALILVEVGEPTIRYSQESEEANNEAMFIKLDLPEKRQN